MSALQILCLQLGCGRRGKGMGIVMKEFVQNILIYTIIIAVLRGLINGPKYRQYFQFFSGVILILLFLGPIFSFFRSDRDWYHVLEEKFLQMDLADIRGEMKVAEEGFEQMLRRRYEETVREQVELLAQERGVSLEDTQVTLKKEGNDWAVAEVSGRITGEMGEEGIDDGSKNEEKMDEKSAYGGGENEGKTDVKKVAVEAVTIGEEPMEDRQEDTSRRGRELKRQICSSFTLGKEQVHLWR